MTEKILEHVEIYPKIFVYKNLFKDINKTYAILKNSKGGEDEFFSPWSKWSHFGEYLSPTVKGRFYHLNLEDVELLKTKTEIAEDQKSVLLEILQNFHLTTKHYIEANNIDFNSDRIVPGTIDKNGDAVEEWKMTGPSIARYRTDIEDEVAMMYHSDYIREPIVSPGYKFAITALAYFNDDYEGGEIDFIVDGEAYMYKPEAGDFLLFPSGHPEILTKNGSVYIHGVMPAKGSSKYLARMYWQKYSVGDKEWFEKEKEFGKDIWESMQDKIMQDFRDSHPNKGSAENERRIK
jgi:hypothetical protein